MISVIVPAVNEAAHLPGVLAALGPPGATHEVLVADGASEDGTAAIAARFGARVVAAGERHRARQMNAAAREAAGAILLFLHADTCPGEGALAAAERSLAKPGVVAGAFRRRFERKSLLLALTSWMADWRTRWWGIGYGDQGLAVRREVFEELGGFDESARYEDIEMCLRLRERGRIVLLGPVARSSARRFPDDLRGTAGRLLGDAREARAFVQAWKQKKPAMEKLTTAGK
ncbi:MAG: TIGR04283 family arsenosugar biosynthesis glycosyltransferase [Sumerlaeia bacterium]